MTARRAAQEGLDFYDKGLYADALDKLERANAIVSAPTLGLMIARCLQKLGRLVEASERYLEVSRTKLDPKASDLFRKAASDAMMEREALLPTIPSITIAVSGSGRGKTEITLDQQPIPSSALGLRRLINPGKHRIEAVRGDLRAAEDLTIKLGEIRDVTLTLAKPSGVSAGGPSGGDASGGGSTQRILGFVAVGVGGAGVIAGAVTGGLAVSKGSELEAGGCRDGHCFKSQGRDVDDYNALRVVSSVSLFVGAGVAAGGVVLLLTAPKSAPKATPARIEPFIGIGAAGVRGRF